MGSDLSKTTMQRLEWIRTENRVAVFDVEAGPYTISSQLDEPT